MKASVIVPTFNSSVLLDRCLRTFRAQILAVSDSLEVLVVDDGSTDSTAETVQRHVSADSRFRYLHLPRSATSSRSAARNRGAEEATGEILIFVDGDQLVPPTFVDRHLRHYRVISAKKAAIGFRKYLRFPGAFNDRFVEDGSEEFLGGIIKSDIRLDLLSRLSGTGGGLKTSWHLFFTCNVSVPSVDYKRVGGFNEEFRGWGLEDSELGYRLERSGTQLVFDEESFAYHQGPPLRPSKPVYEGWLKNLSLFIALHREAPEVILQAMLAPIFNPAVGANWIDLYEQFEMCTRSTPAASPGARVEVADGEFSVPVA
ncbi:glycosyltransferase family 2 protein [Micromonospora chokoriensis]|uniref:Glycosyltransferase involved in cell wall bisynthesis n=1 Tax=Micromonospora chokoriensis TaxID=356851 RepID=A0A1C4U3H7_9ACTN|nr:glycosyltransferase [Micromonospora chokoriensis]SCE66206.1 Glycosyltransferase involved in cell wall bisynthesis [Micromonospora chokoriensis]